MKVAVLGLGRMGRRHLQVVRQLGWDIAGVADLHRDNLTVIADEFAIPTEGRFADPERLLETLRPQCVIVATTAPSHARLTCLAAESGAQFVLCEKPMATSLADCDRMIQVCQAHSTRLAINHQMRFMDQYLRAKELLDSDAVGGLKSITVVAGNFGMAMNGTHYFELLRWLSGDAIHEVTAWFSDERVPNPRGAEFEDRAGSVRITTRSGIRLYLEIGADQGHGIHVVYGGRLGVLVADELSGRLDVSTRRPEDRALPTTRYGMPSEDVSLTVAPADAVAPTKAVLEALVEGRDVPSGEDGRMSVATLIAAHVSDENDHVAVTLDGGRLPRERQFPYA
jgi:predicted dehydrogenase